MSPFDLATLCQQAYLPDGIPGAIADVGAIGPRAFVLDGDRWDLDAKLIVFRGTCDVEGWIEDLEIEKTTVGGAYRVHAGFLRDWQALQRRVRQAVGCKKVIITGHSLGGALATLAANYLNEQVTQVVTFGSPRVGDVDFAAVYGERLAGLTIRCVNNLDPVPFVPFWLAGFRHVCPAMWYDGAAWRDWSLAAWLAATWRRVFVSRELTWRDHLMGRYAAAFEQAKVLT